MSPVSGGDETEAVGEVAPEIDVDLAGLLNSMAVGVWVCDAKGALVAINTAALRIVGARSFDELRSKHHLHAFRNFEFENGAPIPPEHGPMARALAGNEDVVDAMEVTDGTSGDKCVLRVRAAPIRSATGAIMGAVKVAIDVTREYELAHAKDDFIRTAAHELKTPLAVIKANAETALSALEGVPSAASRSLEGLSRGIERVDRLINSLLDLLDIQGGLFSLLRTSVHLDEIVRQAIARLPHRVAARVHAELVPATVLGDEPRLRRAVMSILDNAFKYSPRGTPVGVTLRRDGDFVRITIRDQGIGIPVEQQSRIFEKYFRAHAGTPHDAGGIGVGLFVAREIIVQHGGRVWFESIEHEGTTFHVELPMEPGRQA